MDRLEGAGSWGADRVDFGSRVRLEFRGTQLSSDGGLLVLRELDDPLGLSDLASLALCDSRPGKNTLHRLDGLFRQSVYGRLAGYEDVNDADRLALDPVMRPVVGGRAVDAQAASASRMGRLKTDTLALPENREALADLNGKWTCRFDDRRGLKFIVLDMDSSVSPTRGEQEGTAWNGHFDCTCYHPLFVFNQFGMLERCALRHGNVHSADGRQEVLDPVIERYAKRDLMRFVRADAAYAIPAIYVRLEAAGYFYAIRLPANAVLGSRIAHRMTRPVGRPSPTKVKRFTKTSTIRQLHGTSPAVSSPRSNGIRASCSQRSASSSPTCPWSPTEWCASTTNAAPPSSTFLRMRACEHALPGNASRKASMLPLDAAVVQAVSRQRSAAATACAGLQPGHFASRCIELPEAMADWSLTSLQIKLIKIGARVVRHARAITFQLAEVAVTGPMVRAILTAIRRLRAPSSCA